MNMALSQFSTIFIWISCMFTRMAVNGQFLWAESQAVLTETRYLHYSAHSQDSDYPECIFVFGGWNIWAANDIDCYNITSDEVIYWDNLTMLEAYYAYANPSFMIGNDVYFISSGYDYVINYNVATKEEMTFMSVPISSSGSACVVHDVINANRFYLFDADETYDLYICDIASQSCIEGPSTSDYYYSGSGAYCFIIDNTTDSSDPYLYVIDGLSIDTIERINLTGVTSDTEWETVGDLSIMQRSGWDSCDSCDTYFTRMEGMNVFDFDNYIYIVGGLDWPGAAVSSIIRLNMQDLSAEYVGQFPIGISYAANSVVDNQVYIFGGTTDSGPVSTIASIYYSNGTKILTTLDPIMDDDHVSNVSNVTDLSDVSNVTDLSDVSNVTDLSDVSNVTDLSDVSDISTSNKKKSNDMALTLYLVFALFATVF